MAAATPRILILYGTSEGHTAKVAAAMAASLPAGLDVQVADAAASRGLRADAFAAVIVAASVHAGRYQRPVTRWVRENAAALAARPTAFVSVCLAVLERKPSVTQELEAKLNAWFAATGWRPTTFKIVAGALPYTRYSWWMRFIMRRIVAKAHGDVDTTRDYEYTDWVALAAFVRSFVDRTGLTTRQASTRIAS